MSAPSNAMAPSLEEYAADLCLGAKAKPAGAGPSSISDMRSLDSQTLAFHSRFTAGGQLQWTCTFQSCISSLPHFLLMAAALMQGSGSRGYRTAGCMQRGAKSQME